MKQLIYLAVFWQTLNISAYTPYECGNARTAYGTIPCEGRTIAADHLPFGSKVMLPDGRVLIVQDRFGGGYKDRLDIFLQTEADCWEFGRRWLRCKIETP